MSIPAVLIGRQRRIKITRSLTAKERETLEIDLCLCPSCLAAHPERAAVFKRRRLAMIRRFYICQSDWKPTPEDEASP